MQKMITRRGFIQASVGGAVLGAASMSPITKALMAAVSKNDIKAVAFDAFPIFDPRPVFALCKDMFADKGDAFAQAWFAKIFSYTWLRTMGNHYKSFDGVIDDALTFTATSMSLDVTPENKARLLNIWTTLDAWPDVVPVLDALRGRGIRLGFLSNMTEAMLRANARNAGIEDRFEFYLSTDRVQAYKPEPKAYQMGVDAFALPKEQIAFAAFAGWDAAGASWFGYPTIWINRLGAPAEELNGNPAFAGKDMKDLQRFLIVE